MGWEHCSVVEACLVCMWSWICLQCWGKKIMLTSWLGLY
jgi:hypothetical protein